MGGSQGVPGTAALVPALPYRISQSIMKLTACQSPDKADKATQQVTPTSMLILLGPRAQHHDGLPGPVVTDMAATIQLRRPHTRIARGTSTECSLFAVG